MMGQATGDEMLSEYLGRLAGDFDITPSENGCLVLTPFCRPDGKPIGVDVASLPDGRVRISDRGGSFGYLYLNGLPFSRPALDSVERIADSFGVTCANEVLVAVSDAASVGDTLHRVIQAAMSVTALVAALDTGWLGSGNAANPTAPTVGLLQLERQPSSPFADGALEALKRAAVKARRRNIALLGSVVTYRDGKIVYDTEP